MTLIQRRNSLACPLGALSYVGLSLLRYHYGVCFSRIAIKAHWTDVAFKFEENMLWVQIFTAYGSWIDWQYDEELATDVSLRHTGSYISVSQFQNELTISTIGQRFPTLFYCSDIITVYVFR